MPSSVEAGGSAVMDTVQELRGRVVQVSSFLFFFFPLVGNCLNVFGHLHYVRFDNLIRPYAHEKT